eukprot:TRINITY_DN4330_c0_g1_i1.p1 TRINITY_DN4330_c0_g1~~TRINITY_DN4330_c0_g1_i1.p1  ORF type:complete len:757 (+),score=97.98 TRINITY_DN4330_c0_g1_i1:97-2367(+)
MVDIYAAEDTNGVRFSWNVWPSSRLEGTRMVVPLGALYSPMKAIAGMPKLNYEPVPCKSCRAILNPYCQIDVRAKLWVCPFCYQRNQFPAHYSGITEKTLPAELIPKYSTVEYNLKSNPGIPIFVFVVDTCIDEKDLAALKDSLLMALSLIPPNALVGLITIGTTVQLFELAFSECPKSYVFRGTKAVTQEMIRQILNLNPKASPTKAAPSPVPVKPRQNKFLRPFSEVEVTLETIIEELQRDPYPVTVENRPLRSTGVALSVAHGMLDASFPKCGGRILLFVGGPCTQGPGMIVAPTLKETIRGTRDIAKGKAKHLKSAHKFYTSLSKIAVANGQTVDLFGCSFDAVGVYEMRELVKSTGGRVVQCDGFHVDTFSESFHKMFEAGADGQLPMGTNGSISIQTSREIKICGAIGHCSSLDRKTALVSDTQIGIGGTSAWKLCSLDPHTTLAFFFEVVNQHSNPIPAGHPGIAQFLTVYHKVDGSRIARVTTVCHAWADPAAGRMAIMGGFDQEAAAVLMARIAVFKAEAEETFQVLRWLDRMLIRLVTKFGDFRKDEPESFALTPSFSMYPQFMFHLRRSPFMQVFNVSPDEATYYRFMLNRENVTNSITMIQPTLDKYVLAQPPQPVLLSASVVSKDCILLLDTYFHVVVWRGKNIQAWVDEGYHTQPKYENLRKMLAAPDEDAKAIMNGRIPLPVLINCVEGDSLSRHLIAVLDPDVTHTTSTMGPTTGQQVFTDDVNLTTFMQHLKKLAVTQQ